MVCEALPAWDPERVAFGGLMYLIPILLMFTALTGKHLTFFTLLSGFDQEFFQEEGDDSWV